MNKIQKFAALLLGGMLALSLVGCEEGMGDNGVDGEAKSYKVGVILPLTGQASSLGQEARALFEYRVKEVNDKLKTEGKNVNFELVIEDGKCEGASANTAFQKMTDVDGVKFVFGGLCSSESLSIAPLLEERGVVALSIASSNPDLEGKSKNFFTLSYSDYLVGEKIADELGKYKTVAMVTELNDYNIGLKKTVEKVLGEKYPDTKIVANEEVAKGSAEYRNALNKVKTANPEVFFPNPNPGSTTEALVRQMAEMKDFKPKMVSGFPFMSEEVIKISPDHLEGLVILDAPSISTETFKAYTKKVNDAGLSTKELGGFYTATGVDAVDILTHLIAEYDGDTSKVLTALREETFNGMIGEIYFGDKTFVQGIKTAKFVVKGGKLEAGE